MILHNYICADVAQLVEQLIRNEQVTGSNPAIGSRSKVNSDSLDSSCRFLHGASYLVLVVNPVSFNLLVWVVWVVDDVF